MLGLFQVFWRRGRDFHDLGHRPLFGLRTVMALVGVSFSLLMNYNKHILRLKKVNSPAILDVFGSNQFMSCPWALSLF